MTDINRRDFLKLSALSGAGLLLGFRLPEAGVAGDANALVMNMAQPGDGFTPNAYLHIAADSAVTVMVHRSEMGQGVNTSVPMIVADELEVDWAAIRIEQAPADPVYGNQVTGGSQSISGSYNTLRAAGAAARAMLVAAAAQTWGVDVEMCYAENGAIIHEPTGDRLAYGDLVETASTLPVPRAGEYGLKARADFRIIGARKGLINSQDFVTGKAIFASDIRLPGMLVATVARCPVFGGGVASFDASAAEAVPGVRRVVQIRSGVAVAADTTWAALKGRDALKVTWDEGPNADLSTEAIRQAAAARVHLADDPAVTEAVYEIPYLAHATMEPMTCVADVRADGCDVWAPTQDRQQAKAVAASVTRLPRDSVRVHVPLIGGGFGRRLQVDYVREAVEISQAVGAPIKLFWTRADDVQHDYYHPYRLTHMRAQGDRFSAQSYGGPPAVPTGAWRSVDNFPEAFARECFIDEVAAATGQDPYTFRLAFHHEPLVNVLRLAAEKAGWGTPLPEGWGRGMAAHSTFSVTHVAMVAEVSVENGEVRVHRVVCAVDCGTAVNPDTVEAQMEGGIAFGLSALLHGEITLENGRVQQSNFHDYPVLRMDEMPAVEVYIVPSDAAPTGIGEMGVPPIAPAVLNAVFAATGLRLRRIPIRPEDLR